MIRSLSLLLLLAPSLAGAESRRITLADAVRLAFSVDPIMAQTRITEDRTKLGVLRAQLDRFSLKIDGSLQELYNKNSIGGPRSPSTCSVLIPIPGTAFSLPYTTASTASDCASSSGLLTPPRSDDTFQGNFNVSANLNVPLFSGFRVSANVRRAERQHDAAVSEIRQARRDTSLAVARAYWSVRRVSLLQVVQRQALGRLEEAEQIAGARLQAGLAPPVDKNRASLRRLQLVATIADLAGQEREAAAQLAVALGTSDELVLTDVPNIPDEGPPPVDQLLGTAVKGRAEIVGSRLALEIQHEVVRMAMSAYYPQLTAFTLLQVGNNPYLISVGARAASAGANPFEGIVGNLTIGATLSMNFFDTLNTYTSVRDAKLEEARRAADRRRVGRIIESDVRVAHARLERLYGKRVPLRQVRDVARDNLAILEARYQNGEALMIEFLDAAVELVNAELALADLQAQLAISWVELEAALGHVIGEGT